VSCNKFTIGISIAVIFSLLVTSGISEANESSEQTNEKSVSLVTENQPIPHFENQDKIITTNGTYYKINSDTSGTYAFYKKPRGYSFLVNAPIDVVDWLKDSFQQKNALTIAAIAVSTGALLTIDQKMVNGAQRIGESLHISGKSQMGRASSGSPVMYPVDLGTAIYSLGDGVVPIAISAGMLGYGLISSDVRSIQTSSQLVEGLLSVAIVTQTIKRVTGRESPSEATKPGGTWRFFPSFKEYGSNTPKYDAFPSGHLATGIMTVTVLSDNYPEYTLIKPVGYSLMTLLSFQMMNNGVHWPSDYPLAIAIGYGLGKVVVSKGRQIVSKDGEVQKTASNHKNFTDLVMLPLPYHNGGGFFAVAKF
jgi:hypothetical protein